MNPHELLAKRQPQWNELNQLCHRLASSERAQRLDGAEITRFASLYRAACADLALAEAYQFPTAVVDQLQQLVARAHGLLYLGQPGRLEAAWREIPRAVATDPYVHTAYALFWLMFLAFCLLIQSDRIEGLADAVVGMSQLQQTEASYESGVQRSVGQNVSMTGFYVRNNTGIGLMCFALGVWVLPGLAVLVSNAIVLGTTFGYMTRDQAGGASDAFQEFVMSHGPFELTAIILSAGAGLRIGMSWIDTGGMTRSSALLLGARRSLPILMLAVLLFLAAAIIEGLLSALQLGPGINLWFKGFVSWFTCSALMFYLVIAGILQPWSNQELHWDNLSPEQRPETWI